MSIMDAFWRLLGVQSEEEEEEIMETLPLDGKENKSIKNIVSIHSNKTLKVIVSEPQKFEEAKELADHLKNRKQVIINLEYTPQDISQRIIDFISGTLYALDGQTQQIGRDIFIFAPNNVEINKDSRLLLRKDSFTNTFDPDGGNIND